MRRTLGSIFTQAAGPVLVAVLAAAGLSATTGTTASRGPVDLPAIQPVLGVQGQVHYLPWDAQQFLTMLQGQNGTTSDINSPVRLITSIVSALDGNQVAIDHWEDGYDADPVLAPGATTEVVALDEGQSTVLNNQVPVADIGNLDARGPNMPWYDGGDKLVSTGAIVVTAGGWASGSGTLHAGAAAVRNSNAAGLEFVSPVGEGMTYPAGQTALASLWEYTGLVIVATQDATTVDYEGTTILLDEGDTHLVDGGVALGDTVTADKPVSVFLSTGDNGVNYEGRLFALLPTSSWSDSYLTPVGSGPNTGLGSRVFFSNPGASAITVTATAPGGGTTAISVPASGQASHLLPAGEGARFASPGNPFYALHVVTTPESGATDNSRNYNWGFALTPERSLTPMVVVGYGPGSDDFDGTGGVDGNDSAVYVTSTSDTTVYVDLDANPDTGALTDVDGNQYDFSCAATAVVPLLVKDIGTTSCSTMGLYDRADGAAGDNDMTGARLYTVDGVLLAAAWGQVPGAANPGTPAIDMGTTVLPFPTIDLDKSSEVLGDDGDGKAVPGDVIRYTVTITNRGISPVDDLTLNDQVPVNTSYVEDSTTAGGAPVADAPAGTPFPLDEGGLLIPPVLDPNQTRVVTYDLLVDDPLPPGVTEILNEITLETDYGDYEDANEQPVAVPGSIGDFVWNDANGDGVQDGITEPGLADVDLELVDDAGDVVATTTTDANGAYLFDAVYPGTYTVRVTGGSGLTGRVATWDRDDLLVGPDGEAEATVAEDQDLTDVDFGYATSTISLEKTVYAGHDGGSGCPGLGTELVSGENGDDVTYCFEITNTGAIALVGVGVDDPDLAIDESDMEVESGELATLAPGGSVVLSWSGAQITGDLVNTATAEAFVTVGGVRRTHTDTAEVAVIGPGITIQKTVYKGHDGGDSCTTAVEDVTQRDGGPVTYCFLVTNSGQTNLSAVTFEDPALGVADGDQTHALLTPGESHTFHVDAAVDGDLTNTATASGTSPAGVQPTASDSASVDAYVPSIDVQNTIHAGHSGGADCATAVEDITVLTGSPVTWCFTVTNAGDSNLSGITLADVALGVDEGDLTVLSGSLADLTAGGSVTLYLERSGTSDVANSVTAVGTPPDGALVSDTDTASLDVVAPAIALDKGVYLDHDGGELCNTVDDLETADGELDTEITWCFTVTNTGDTVLDDVTIEDLPLGVDETDLALVAGSLDSIDPGDSVVLHLDGTITGDLINVAEATGTPPVGSPVSDEDGAGVGVLDPGVTVAKTVYAGHDGGTGCPGTDLVQTRPDDEVTWCVRAENTGDVDLAVHVTDPDAGIDETLTGMAPGDVEWVFAEGTSDGDLVNTASVEGTTPLGATVDDSDDAEIDEIHPSLAVAKTVYAGHDGGASCGPALNSIEAELGDDVTWCFSITNTGDVDLHDLTLLDAVLDDGNGGDVDEADVSGPAGWQDGLASGASVVVHWDDQVAIGEVNNNVTVGATAPNDDTVSATDPASIEVIGPEIGISKAVLAGPVGNGDGTYTLSYRLRVVNSGDTPLEGVQVADDLSETFAAAASFRVTGTSSAVFTLYGDYTGRPSGSTDLLVGTDSLAVGDVGEITIDVVVDPGNDLGPYQNTAFADGTSPGDEHVQDVSDSGLEPDPEDPNTGEPGDTAGTDDPVPVEFPGIDLTVTKDVEDIQQTGIDMALIEWRIAVRNEGLGDDPGPVTVVDELGEGLDLVSAGGEGWECEERDRTVSCIWADPLPAGASTTEIQVLTDATSPSRQDTTFVNSAHVASTRDEGRLDNNDSDARVRSDWQEIPATPSSLPRTGAAVGGLLLLGLGLVFGGRLLQRRAPALSDQPRSSSS